MVRTIEAGQVIGTLTIPQFLHLRCQHVAHRTSSSNEDRGRTRVPAAPQVSLIDMLFRKSLRLSAAARAEHGAGGIANLQANDCTKLYGLVQYLHVLWSGPFQVRQSKDGVPASCWP